MGNQKSQNLSGGSITASGGDGALHTVAKGECVSSIARDAGLFWETLWDHPANFLLKSQRKDPNILLPGDVILVPRTTPKEVSCQTDKRHPFIRKGVPTMLRLQVLDNGEIQANTTYILIVDGAVFSGETDAEGKLEHCISCNAKTAKLIVGPQQREYVLDLGDLDPITEMTGVQGRLRNLDYYDGDLDGALNEKTDQALREFQTRYKLQVTGQPDQATRAKIQEVHGS